MQKTFEAVYGVLCPLTQMALSNSQQVQVTIADLDKDLARRILSRLSKWRARNMVLYFV